MKLTKSKLQQIIKEEIDQVMVDEGIWKGIKGAYRLAKRIRKGAKRRQAYKDKYGEAPKLSHVVTKWGGKPKDQQDVEEKKPEDQQGQQAVEEEKKPLQKLAKGIEKRGTEGDFSKYCGGEVTQACIDKAAKAGGHRAKQASLAATFSKAKGGGPTLKYPKKKKD